MYSNFEELILSWVSDMKDSFPEFSEQLDKVPTYPNLKDVVKENFTKHSEKLAAMDDSVFAEPGVELLPGIDFHLVWKLEGISDTTKEALWKYIMFTMGWSLVGDMLFNLKAPEGEAPMDMSLDGVNEMFEGMFKNLVDENIPKEFMEGKLGQLVQEIAKKIKPEELGFDVNASPMVMIKAIMERKEELIQKLMGIVKTVIDEKIASGELKMEELREEVMKLQKTMGKMMAGFGAGHDTRASMDPRRQKVLERLRKKRDGKK